MSVCVRLVVPGCVCAGRCPCMMCVRVHVCVSGVTTTHDDEEGAALVLRDV